MRKLCRFAPIQGVTFYFRAPLDVAVERMLSGRQKLKYYEAGMDLGMSYGRAESFRLFQARILEEYDKMVDTDNFVVLDGTLPVNKLQKQMRDIVASKIDLKRFAPRVQEPEGACRTRKKRKRQERFLPRKLPQLRRRQPAKPQ